jgi:hypothetical protein
LELFHRIEKIVDKNYDDVNRFLGMIAIHALDKVGLGVKSPLDGR